MQYTASGKASPEDLFIRFLSFFQHLKVQTVLTGDSCPVPSTHVGWLTTAIVD